MLKKPILLQKRVGDTLKHLKIALVCAFTALALPAQAATVKLNLNRNSVPDFADTGVHNGDTARAGDFALTFQNIRVRDGSARGSVFSSGISLSGGFDNTIVTADLIFGTDTIITRYDLGFTNSGPATFQLSGVNGTSGLNSLASAGTSVFDMGTIPVFLAGVSYTLTHTVTTARTAQLRALYLASPPPAVIPLPTSLPLLLAGVGAVAILRRRTPAARRGVHS